MGKGAIISGGDDGLYSIKLNLNKDRVETLFGIIDNQIAALSAKLAGMEEGKEKEVVKLKQSSYEKKKEYLQNNQPEDPTVPAWCADLTEDVSGNVGTIEVPGERGIVQIQPGYENNAVYNQTRDGQLQPAVAGTPASVFYNLAMLPGWQKWMPTHRHGIISNIDTDNNTCDVTLDKVKSSQQSLKINQTDKLTGIAIEYMSCDAVAFENGDPVLVEFAGQILEGAKVVGFKDNPKPCEYEFYIRPTFNGYSPIYGGESIKLENEDVDETASTTVDGDFAGFCGPFTQDVDTGDEHIFLNTSVAAGINPNYSGVNNIFAHYVEVPEVEAAYHYGYIFNTLDWFSAGKKEFEVGDGIGTPLLHVNRVTWLRYGSILSDCTKTTETIDGVKYTVYEVRFTELYFPALARTLKKYLSTWSCTGCGAIEDSQEAPIRYELMIRSIDADLTNTGNICDGYGEACGSELPECKAWFLDAISGHTPEISISKNQFCVLSDEYGKSPSYTPITIDSNLYVHEQFIYRPFNGGEICRVDTTDYADSEERKYEFTLAPEDKF